MERFLYLCSSVSISGFISELCAKISLRKRKDQKIADLYSHFLTETDIIILPKVKRFSDIKLQGSMGHEDFTA